jgi:tetraacyldisaccharide 4'-kinase
MINFLRNKCYDWGILRKTSFNFPVISVGNLSMGGSGKTPHVEYLVRLLKNNFKLATLSRGYGRNTRGFLIASAKSHSKEIGDEPVQFKQKFPDLLVAVDERRVHGIRQLKNKHPEIEVVVLDDAFQHRALKPGLNILLTDFHNLYPEDYPFPTGQLREFRSGSKRADIIVVTKTPSILSPITVRRIQGLIKPKPYQKLYFSYIKYGPITLMPGSKAPETPEKYNTVLLFAGIANIYPLEEHVRGITNHLEILQFNDHHNYSSKDLEKIREKFETIYTRNKIIITTEKDAMRLSLPEVPEFISDLPIYYIPIEIKLHRDYRKDFNDQIINYVTENSTNSRIHSKPN